MKLIQHTTINTIASTHTLYHLNIYYLC